VGVVGAYLAWLRYAVPTPAMMKYLIAFTRGMHSAIGISLPKPEQEKAVALVWLVAAVLFVLIIVGTGWLVLNSMSNSVSYR